MEKQVCYYLHSSQLYVTFGKKRCSTVYPDFSNTTAGSFDLKQGTPFPRQTMPEFYPRLFVSRFENSPLHYLKKMHFDKQMLVSRPYSKRLRKCPNSIATEITPEKEDSTDLSRFFDVSFIITEQ